MPQCSPAHHIKEGHDDMSQACPLEHGPDGKRDPSQQARQEQQGPPSEKQGECVPSEKQGERVPESESRKKIPYHTRPVYVPMKGFATIRDKWFARDKFLREHQIKSQYARDSEPTDTSTLHQLPKKYPNIEAINWTEDCPKI